MQETRSNFEQFLGCSEDGEMVAYEMLRRVVEDIYGVGAMVERVNEMCIRDRPRKGRRKERQMIETGTRYRCDRCKFTVFAVS